MMVRGQSPEVTPCTGRQFKTEAKDRVDSGSRWCWCLCKIKKSIFPVGEELLPDPEVLEFISAADFKQGFQRVNEMTDAFTNSSQPYETPWYQGVVSCVSFLLMVWNCVASLLGPLAAGAALPPLLDNYPGWATGVGWVVVVGMWVLLVRENNKKETMFVENVETELTQRVWNKAVARGAVVKYSIEQSGGESNTSTPAAVTITLP